MNVATRKLCYSGNRSSQNKKGNYSYPPNSVNMFTKKFCCKCYMHTYDHMHKDTWTLTCIYTNTLCPSNLGGPAGKVTGTALVDCDGEVGI